MIQARDILNARILIVDDQDANILLLTQLLGQAGYCNLHSTMQPAEVAGLHRSAAYDLILLDLQMPVMDGFAVMQALQEERPDDYLPVIVLTAQPGHKLRALQAGAKDFISKPFDLAEVKMRIHNMLEVRLLYQRLADFNVQLEQAVQERTTELRESEARYRSLTELASDWYWEQDAEGQFTRVSGPVQEMLGLQEAADSTSASSTSTTSSGPSGAPAQGWIESERAQLRARIAQREPFLDFVFHRVGSAGTRQQFRVSGEPMFSQQGRFMGYRGIGVEMGVEMGLEPGNQQP
jgi:CheY-like chemotaxis protein